MKKYLLFAIAFVCTSINVWAGPLDVMQDPDDNTKYWIGTKPGEPPTPEGDNYFTVADGVVTFHVNKSHFKPAEQEWEVEDVINKAWNNISNKFSGATRIKFANDCCITKADLERFLQGNTYYVDLFDITNGTNTPMQIDDISTEDDDNSVFNIDKIIEAAVEDMIANNWQAKGIILPLNTGSGTSKVEKATNNGGETFTEYAVYYRETQKTATIYAHDGNMRYSFEWVSSNTDAQNHYNTAYEHLSSHSLVANAKTFIVSTNNKMRGSDQGIDVSSTITGSDITKISIINDEMVYLNQTGRSYLATITVDGAAEGAFAAAVTNTGIKYTPCEKLIVQGPVNGNDVKAVNEFSTADGPLVYSLAGATGVTQALLKDITNNDINYLVLPYGMATEQIDASNFSSSLTNLKAAIATSSDKTKLSAYVKVAGSLGMARYYATGGSYDPNNTPHYTPTKTNLTDVILSGYLNASDLVTKTEISNIDDDGHWGGYNTNVILGMNQEFGITSIDLENAVFETQSDMNFYKAGYENLTSVKLPTSSSMNTIPARCLYNNSNLTYLCVPYNYEYIEDGAFWLTGIDHMTTTDAAGAEVDNGPKSWTISANVKQLGITPTTPGAMVETIYPQNVGVQDIYCLAIKVPKCYGNVFPANACYGWGGDDPQQPYCRDRYFNGGNKNEAWAVLHFPSKESWETSAGTKEASYEALQQYYTDVNKVFTKKEQTGAVDANGNPIAWPTHWEGYRAYNQASFGYTWNDWAETHNSTIEGHVNGGSEVNQGVAVGQVYSCPAMEADGGTGTGQGDYDFADYIGWHQIVLAVATYVEPDEKIEQEKIIREYELAGWYTFCIPFDMSIAQVQQMLGVPKSEGNVICKLDGVEVTTPIMPDIRQLYSVSRKKGSGSESNIVFLRMTRNLWNETDYKAQYLDFNLNASPKNVISHVDAQPSGSTTIDDARCLVGGRPYIIKAYKRKGEVIKGQNLGKLIMTRYGDQFGVEASCVSSGLYEQLGNGTLVTLRFAIPYENHKVQAMKDSEDAEYLEYNEDGTAKRYFYTMVGQYWQQPLPQYCIYMSKGKWYRFTDTSKPWTWDPYKCVIMATQEIDDGHPNGGKYRDNDNSNYPNIVSGTTDLLDGEFKLGFLHGRDDDDFENYESAKYMFVFDDDVMELDVDGNEFTAIECLDGESLVTEPVNGKVYNMAGQVVGRSLNGLSKGMYIVNGKKYVVK